MNALKFKNGIRFTLNVQIDRRQVKTIEDEEFADLFDDHSSLTYLDDIDRAEIIVFSIRKT